MVGDFDALDFRAAAGQFMTGVTIITTLDDAGNPSGLTVNSFSTVSLHPPMVLFCLGNDSSNLEAFEAGTGYVVHVLAAEQENLSIRFAAKGIDRFEDLDWTPGLNDMPVLAGALATFECDLVHSYAGGDHVIYVGEVKRLTTSGVERDALGYFRGRYVTAPHKV